MVCAVCACIALKQTAYAAVQRCDIGKYLGHNCFAEKIDQTVNVFRFKIKVNTVVSNFERISYFATGHHNPQLKRINKLS